MTGDEDEASTMAQITQLEESVSSNSVTLPSTTFISSNMAAESSCIYTAAIPPNFPENFPEGMYKYKIIFLQVVKKNLCLNVIKKT